MTEEVADLLKKAMALPLEAREVLAISLVKSLGDSRHVPTINPWADKHRDKARAGLKRSGRVGYMEVTFQPIANSTHNTQPELVRAAESAAIHAFGWPIGVVLHTDEGRPRPLSEGVVAEISGIDSSYDYWALRANGDFYFLGSLFEDERTQNAVWFDTRIVRVTEAFLFCYRLYKALGLPEESTVRIVLRHGGLRGRVLGSATPGIWQNRASQEEEAEWESTLQLHSIRTGLRDNVKAALSPLFILFDFFEPPDEQVYSQIDKFLNMVKNQQQPFDL